MTDNHQNNTAWEQITELKMIAIQQDVKMLVSSDKGNFSLAAVGLKAITGFPYSSFTKFKNPTSISHLQNTHGHTLSSTPKVFPEWTPAPKGISCPLPALQRKKQSLTNAVRREIILHKYCTGFQDLAAQWGNYPQLWEVVTLTQHQLCNFRRILNVELQELSKIHITLSFPSHLLDLFCSFT